MHTGWRRGGGGERGAAWAAPPAAPSPLPTPRATRGPPSPQPGPKHLRARAERGTFVGPLPGPRCPTLAPSAFFFFLLILNNGISVCLRLNHVDPPSFPFLFIPFPTPPSPAFWFFLKPFSLGWGGGEKKRKKKNFPRPCKLVPEGFQPLPGWSDEKREGERLKRRVDGFFSPRPGRGLQPTHQIHLKCKYELPEQMLQHKTETHVRPGGKRARARRAARGPGRARPLPAGGPRRPGHPPEPASRAPGATPQAPLGPPLCAPHALPRRAACASQASLELQRVSDSLVFSSERLDRSPEDTRWKIVALLTQQPTRDVP